MSAPATTTMDPTPAIPAPQLFSLVGQNVLITGATRGVYLFVIYFLCAFSTFFYFSYPICFSYLLFRFLAFPITVSVPYRRIYEPFIASFYFYHFMFLFTPLFFSILPPDLALFHPLCFFGLLFPLLPFFLPSFLDTPSPDDSLGHLSDFSFPPSFPSCHNRLGSPENPSVCSCEPDLSKKRTLSWLYALYAPYTLDLRFKFAGR